MTHSESTNGKEGLLKDESFIIEETFKSTATIESREGGNIIESKRNMPDFAVTAQEIRKSYSEGDKEIEVLKGINLEIKMGEIVAIVGPSGAGKSTLLHSLGLMESITSGDLTVLGFKIQDTHESEKDTLRNRYIGFLFQFHHLLPELSLLENVALPLRIARTPEAESMKAAEELLNSVGLSKRVSHLPSQVSGGEQQRAALARAMVHHPALLLCDEPTGNLDLERGEEVRDLIWRIARARHSTVLIATHNLDIAGSADRIIRILDGKIVE